MRLTRPTLTSLVYIGVSRKEENFSQLITQTSTGQEMFLISCCSDKTFDVFLQYTDKMSLLFNCVASV